MMSMPTASVASTVSAPTSAARTAPGRADRAAARPCAVAIIGAGPYGLSAAAHLRAAGIETRVFGRAMEFWAERMPRGMLLRSSWEASQIADPRAALTLEAFEAARGRSLPRPIPGEAFVEYGRWFQRQAVPDLDERRVAEVERGASGLRLRLEDGELLEAERVVIAAGIAPFGYHPPEFAGLPPSLISHTVDHADLGGFAGRRVLVVGAGQSALESAALLSEAGAEVEVVARTAQLRWLARSARLHRIGGPLHRLLYPPTDVGPPGLNWLVALPDLFRRLPRRLQDPIAYRSIRPAASAWVRPRIGAVRITTGERVIGAEADGEQVAVTLASGERRRVDHVLLATGYRIDITQYGLLGPDLRGLARCAAGYPVLGDGFESSVPGLHFLGAPAAWSFGPLMRFVAGTGYTGRALARTLLRAGAPATTADARDG